MNQLPQAVKNQSLFSNYYLDSLIGEQTQWADTPDIESDYAAIKARFDAVAPNAEHLNEAQTEHEFIQPLLEQLGHIFEVQPTLQAQGPKRPDYAFFASSDAHDAAQPHINTNQFFNTALAVGDAKAWSRNLDRKTQDGGDPFNNQNPNYQIDFYLRGADKDWGILTNGRQWRLYHRQTSYRLDNFYEVDLAALLSENGDLDAFRYFYSLFRRDAFLPDPSGTSFLNLVLGESQQYTVAVSDDLKNRVYDALRLLIDGFLKFPRNSFDQANPPLHEVHTNCLILLYRILFILYAESRGLLPVENPNYAADYSLASLAETIHQTLDQGGLIIPTISDYWARLRGLFGLINNGWDDLIPQYNGGLFNPESHPFLEENELGNEALAQVIELLTRTKEGERITYRDLDVRHLGDIYEGLLEYQPQIADQDLAIVSRRGSEKVEPKSSPDQEVAYSEGDVYLLTDKGERKATGSYYTPDYIVRYIVENTLAPLCEGKTVDEILSLKILDPATGSGHFLVGVVDYLAEELITHPDAPHITETTDAETELAYWRRRVVESCVYGVDLNPMAVELAKLSLWLHTVAKGEPLSFLDHHIRCGNSLIGAKIENLPNLPELRRRRSTGETQAEFQMEFPFTDRVATAIGHYLLIEETESRTADQIHAKEHQLDIAQQMLRLHKGVANLWTSVYFDNSVSRSTYQQALNALRSQNTDALDNLLSYQRAQAMAEEKRFFHWEIEFPEVFRDRHGREKDNPGFDAVIGNPPYANAWGMTNVDSQDRSAIQKLCYISGLLKGHWDLYAAFIIRSLELLCKQGYHAFIVPDALATEKYADRLREFLLKNTRLLILLHFEGINVFEDVSRHCFIYTLTLGNPDPQSETVLYVPDLTIGKEKQIGQIQQTEWLSSENYQIRFQLANPSIRSLGNKIRARSIRLGQFCYVMVGATTHSKDEGSFTKADIVSTQEIGNAKRFIDGKNLRRYDIDWDGRYIDYRQDEMYGPRVPELFESEKIVVRDVTGANEQLIVSYDNNEFYCDHLITCVTYYENIERTTAQTDFAGYDKISPPYPALSYTTALLGSSLLTWFFRVYFATGTLQGSYSHTYPQQVRAMPIRRINFTTPADERDRQLEKAKTLYQRCLDRGSTDCVLGFVKHHLAADPERSDIVHDLLAVLAAEMVEMNKTKGEEIRGFLRWLEREIGAEIDTLQNKTKIQGYFDLSFEELLEILRSNRRRIAIDPSSRDFQESLEREFTNSLDTLNPLLTRIQGTDTLIDQVVYQLYGLTDEEIAVVEGGV